MRPDRTSAERHLAASASTSVRTMRALARACTFALLVAAGCGYTVRPPFQHSQFTRTVYVQVFRSISFRRDVQLQLTELVKKEIESRTPYKVVGKEEGADTILSGEVNLADKNIVVENPFNLPRQLSATLNVAVKWTRNPPLDSEVNAEPVLVSETVNFNPEIGETSMTAFYRTNQRLAQQIIDMMEAPWAGE